MQVEVTSSYLELGLVFIGSVTVAVLTVLLCTCFKKRGASIADDHKNGHILVAARLSGVLDPEFEDEDLKGAKATSHRRLPDIPDSVPNGSDNPDARQSSVRSSQDTSSELYAQVEIGPTANSFPVNSKVGKEVEAPRLGPAFGTQPEETPESHPYDKVKSNHGYSKIKKKAENPYAKVKRSDTMESENAEADENETDTDNYDVVYTVDETKKADPSPHAATTSAESSSLLPPPLPFPLRGSHSSLASGDSAPRPPPRGRRGNSIVLSHASSGSNILRPNSLVLSDQESVVQDAVDGAIATEDEPPIEVHGAGTAQIYFSGDSQASQDSKGYSSISVREPLANLKAQNPGMAVGRQRIGSSNNANRQIESVDSHYATVSDAEDSDEMYAAIAELPSVYDNATGSDTYARINERAEAQTLGAVNAAPSNGAAAIAASPPPSLPSESELSPSSPLPPAPPSVVLLKQLSSGSSRLHASTLSIASQTSGVGSPKPEKRQANSPLPPTPVSQDPVEGSRRSMNVEEMYAKVMKKKALHPWQSADCQSGKGQQHRGSVDLGFLASRDPDSFVADVSRRNSADFSSHRTVAEPAAESVLAIEPSIQENSVTGLEEDDDEEDLRYEVLPAARNDRQASESDPGYERIQLKSGDSFNEPRYERIQPKREGEVEPNYEVVGFQGALEGEISEHGYETVELSAQAFDRQDPNYESLHYSVHSIAPDPPYASIMARDANNEDEQIVGETVVAEPVVNNNTVDVPVYAQVVKSKRTTVQQTSPAPDGEPPQAEAEIGAFQPTMTVHTQDYSVSSSKNTTIIRITDNSPSFRFFADQNSFGVPEQV